MAIMTGWPYAWLCASRGFRAVCQAGPSPVARRQHDNTGRTGAAGNLGVNTDTTASLGGNTDTQQPGVGVNANYANINNNATDNAGGGAAHQ